MRLFLWRVKSRTSISEDRRASAKHSLLRHSPNVNELWESNSFKEVRKWKLK